jgi:hypothetical protein
MTPPLHRSRFRSGPIATATSAAVVAIAAGIIAFPRAAAAQACCVGTGLVTPGRLRPFESGLVGFQMRARSVMGEFGGTGSYAPSSSYREIGFEEDLYGALRLGRHLQIGVLAPFVQTGRQAGVLSGWGGGLGDVAVNARFDALNAGEHGHWPGVAVIAALTAPTGQPLDEVSSSDPLSTSGTGTGSFEASVGLAVEEIVGNGFVSAAGFVSQRTSRASMGVDQSFAPRWSALLSGGYTFGHDTTIGAFASALRQGHSHDANGEIANSDVALVTAGGALATPFWVWWRLQATLFSDVPIAGLGRNLTVGYGGTVAISRFWI